MNVFVIFTGLFIVMFPVEAFTENVFSSFPKEIRKLLPGICDYKEERGIVLCIRHKAMYWQRKPSINTGPIHYRIGPHVHWAAKSYAVYQHHSKAELELLLVSKPVWGLLRVREQFLSTVLGSAQFRAQEVGIRFGNSLYHCTQTTPGHLPSASFTNPHPRINFPLFDGQRSATGSCQPSEWQMPSVNWCRLILSHSWPTQNALQHIWSRHCWCSFRATSAVLIKDQALRQAKSSVSQLTAKYGNL